MAAGKLSFGLVVLHLSYCLCAYVDIPEKCKRPPPGDVKPHECCKLPEIFPPEELQECGFKNLEELKKAEPRGPPDCEKQICLLKKHNLMKDENDIDLAAVGTFLDQWTEKNPAYNDSVAIAKQTCLRNPLPGPPGICEPNKLVFCVGATMFTECPHWEESENCAILKNHIEECKTHFKRT